MSSASFTLQLPLKWPLVLGAVAAAAPLTNLHYVQIGAFIACAVAVCRDLYRAKIRGAAAEWCVLAFSLFAIISPLWADTGEFPVSAWSVLFEYGGIAAIVTAVSRTCGDRYRWRFIGWCYIAGCSVAFLLIANHWMAGTFVEAEGRYSIAGVNANYSAYSLVTGIPVVLGLFWTSQRTSLSRVVTGAYVALLGAAIVMTACRGAVLAYGCALSVLAFRLVRRRPVVGAVALALVVIATIALAPRWIELLPSRLTALDPKHADDLSSGRLLLWGRAADMFMDSPVVGHGANTYASLEGMHAHNIVLSVLAELGIVGMLLLALALTVLFHCSMGSGAPGWGRYTAVMLLSVWAVIAATGVWHFAQPAWLAFAWVACIPRMQRAADTSGSARRETETTSPAMRTPWRSA